MPVLTKTPKRRTEATVRDEVRAALGMIPGVTLYDNHERPVTINGRTFYMPGIGGKGFPDLVGFVRVPIDALYRAGVRDVPVFASMELKAASTHDHGAHENEQRAVTEGLAGLGTATGPFVYSGADAETVARTWLGGRLRA